jgi:hypothetical protein
MLFIANVLHKHLAHVLILDLPGNMTLTIGIPWGIEKQGLFFIFSAYTKFKKEIKKKIMQQNNTVLYKVALLGP